MDRLIKTFPGVKTDNSVLKDTNNTSGQCEQFIGFDIGDDVLTVIDNKKKSVKIMIKEISTDKLSSSSSNVNHVKKRKKSVVSSPETNDVKNNRKVSKKPKKALLLGPSNDSVELNVQPSLELTTPTFNLTSAPRSRGRKMNVDISDPILKLPFDHGWKRELVYRTTGDNRTFPRNGDVYYYSPDNRKFRSFKEIQEQLDLASDNYLTIDSFTFLKQPIGMNDRTKELIREAGNKLSKEDSFITAVKPKKPKTPVHPPFDFELSDEESRKPSNKMKVVFKSVKKKPTKFKSKQEKNISEVINSSLSTPEYTNDDFYNSIQSNEASKVFSPSKTDFETNTSVIERRLSASDGEVIMQAPCGIRCPNNDEPATLMCAQCLVYYHPACVSLNANLKIVGYVCINCRSPVQQKSRCLQSSTHSVVVNASEPEKLRVEPIRIRQVHQASDTPNFFIDRTPISKSEEIESTASIDDNNSNINTVICQGSVYKTKMIPGSFHEQYVYEMKQTRGPSLMTCVVQEPKYLDENAEINGSLKETPVPTISMQSVNYMVKSLKHIFKYLKVHELLSASRVCSAWNIVAMDKDLWKNVRLKNSMVFNWQKFVETIDSQCSISLDTRRMLIPVNTSEYDNFWLCFSVALKKATKLKSIELYRCPPQIVEDIIYSLPQLAVLNATSIKNPNYSKEAKNPVDIMTLNLKYLGQMSNLTEIRLKGLSGMKLEALPSFEKLVNLKFLSLTSIKAFPKDVNQSLQTVTTELEYFEIGDCDCLSKGFAEVLNRFENLTSLRLENCCGKFDLLAQEIFQEIRNLKKLNVLELINVNFSSAVEDELEKCDGINALLIIPAYVSQSATTNCHLIDCLKKLSKTLTHVVWGLTNELLRVTDLFITQYQENRHSIGYSLELSNNKERGNNIPILRTRKPRQPPGEEEPLSSEKDQDKSNNVDILSVTALEKLLETMMINAKTKVIKVPFSSTTRVYLAEQFKDL